MFQLFIHPLYLLWYFLLQGGTMFNQQYSVENLLGQTEDTLRGAGGGIANVASILIAVVGIALVIWGFIKRSQDNGSDNAIWKVGVGMIAAVIIISIARLFGGF